ncbi:glycosyltransferase [Porphyromonas pogonae]|uniref:glycosyltransferase n=1 Tax=Porphyromonas pogonae TaxID=867595 RepID=UPI002E79E558|nr:glycosyltransferase [Porphyromonas pogonae]
MKVLFLNTYESGGGAAIATTRLMEALRKIGVDARLLVLYSDNIPKAYVDELTSSRVMGLIAKARFISERGLIYYANGRDRSRMFKVSTASMGFNILHHPWVINADVIHINWINQGFLSLNGIKALLELKKLVFWTMHDMWPATGICHLPYYLSPKGDIKSCSRYTEECGYCPFLKSSKPRDLSYTGLMRKRFLGNGDIQFIAVSNWLKEQVRISANLKRCNIEVVHNPIDTKAFRPIPASEETDWLTPESIPIVMSAARLDDPIKGPSLCVKTINRLCHIEPSLINYGRLVLIGNIKDKRVFSDIKMPVYCLGHVDDEVSLASIYSVARVTISTSLCETFGQTLTESLACGCPVVAFDFGGQTDIIKPGINGYLTPAYDTRAMAINILKAIELSDNPQGRSQCKESVQKFNATAIAEKMKQLYLSKLNKGSDL